MKMSRLGATLVAVVCAGGAQAVPRLTSQVFMFPPSGYVGDGQTLIASPDPLPPDSTVSSSLSRSYAIDNFPVDDNGTLVSSASAGFGWLRAETRARYKWFQLGALGGATSYATAGFTDTMVLNNGTPGSTGIATFGLRVTGFLYENYSFDSGMAMESVAALNFSQSGGTLIGGATPVSRDWQWNSISEPQLLTEFLSVNLQYTSGVPIEFSTTLRCLSGYSFGSKVAGGFAEAETGCALGSTVEWLGLLASVDGGGNPLGVSISSLTGTNYAAAIAAPSLGGGVPEPSSWALLLLGFAGVGLAARRRRTIAA